MCSPAELPARSAALLRCCKSTPAAGHMLSIVTPQQRYGACVCSYLRCLSYAFRSYAAHWPAQHCVSQIWQIADAAAACCSRASSDFADYLQGYDLWNAFCARPVHPAAGDGYAHTRSVTQLEEHGAASHSKTSRPAKQARIRS